jgi:hypothetical protein
MSVLTQPAVSCNLEEIRPLPWVGDEYPTEKISRVGGYIFGKRQGGRDNILVKQIDVVAFRVGWVIVKR